MRKHVLALGLALTLLLSACGGTAAEAEPDESTAAEEVVEPVDIPDEPEESEPVEEEPVEPEPEPEPEPELPANLNPLTGLEIPEEKLNARPVAIMLNNLKAALPQHGVSQADIIYEVLAEGGITRMLGVFQCPEEVGNIGSVRSTRPYYLELALGHDAILMHAGGSEDAYTKIKSWEMTALDCVNGPYEGTLYWRDKARIKNAGFEHSVFTSGEKIASLFPPTR